MIFITHILYKDTITYIWEEIQIYKNKANNNKSTNEQIQAKLYKTQQNVQNT